jgi:short-subunit dehydrogenase
MKLAGRNVLITGGSGGIGSELARSLLAEGARVLITGRNLAVLERTRGLLLRDYPPESVGTCSADLASAAERERLVTCARQWQGGIDVLINNAGVSEFGLLEGLTEADIEAAIAINVTAPVMLCRSLMPHLQSRPEAHIVNIGSVFGGIGYPGFAVYSATKFALRGFSEALRRELEQTSVRVHYFAPRATRTDFNAGAVDAMNEEMGVAMDTPRGVATEICALLKAGRNEATLGWPEKLFVRINALLPGLVDASIAKQLPIIRKFARAAPVTEQDFAAHSVLP